MSVATFEYVPPRSSRMTPNAAGARMGVARRSIDKLRASELLAADLDERAVDSLARRQLLSATHGELTVLRTNSTKQVEETDRDRIGFHLTYDDQMLETTSLRWWRGDADRVLGNRLFAVTVGTVPVAVYEVTGLVATTTVEDDIRHHFAGTLLTRVVPFGSDDSSTTVPSQAIDSFQIVARVEAQHPLLAPAMQIMNSRVVVDSGGPIGYLSSSTDG